MYIDVPPYEYEYKDIRNNYNKFVVSFLCQLTLMITSWYAHIRTQNMVTWPFIWEIFTIGSSSFKGLREKSCYRFWMRMICRKQFSSPSSLGCPCIVSLQIRICYQSLVNACVTNVLGVMQAIPVATWIQPSPSPSPILPSSPVVMDSPGVGKAVSRGWRHTIGVA